MRQQQHTAARAGAVRPQWAKIRGRLSKDSSAAAAIAAAQAAAMYHAKLEAAASAGGNGYARQIDEDDGRPDGYVKIMPLVAPTPQLKLRWTELSWSVVAEGGNEMCLYMDIHIQIFTFIFLIKFFQNVYSERE